jgi:iron(III) transport system ATP-binding protein
MHRRLHSGSMRFSEKNFRQRHKNLNMTIAFSDISHKFGEQTALANINLEIADGEIVCILGPSGSGKSTLLRIAAGLEPVQSGCIYLNDQILADPNTNPPPEKRPIGLVFQDHVLFPHLTVAENIAFGLNHLSKTESARIVAQQLATVDLSEARERYPHTLSGGQQQRVALIRALATHPSVMLLDEPFASVDTPLRRKLREQARLALKSAGTPTLIVTHDPEEAMDMADRILVLVEGRKVQLGAPEELWRAPQNPFVAQTVAAMQTIKGKVSGKSIQTQFGQIPFEQLNNLTIEPEENAPLAEENLQQGQSVILSMRASSLTIDASNGPAIISDKRFLGRTYLTLITLADEQIRIESTAPQELPLGTLVDINFASAETLIYS